MPLGVAAKTVAPEPEPETTTLFTVLLARPLFAVVNCDQLEPLNIDSPAFVAA